MQYIVPRKINKNIQNLIENVSREISSFDLKQTLYAIDLPYYFSREELDTIQQVYCKKNRYIYYAILTNEEIKARIKVDALLGLKKEMSYVPASTISAIVSQCSALALWSILRTEVEDPITVYNRLVENELVGFKREDAVYRQRIPLKTELLASIKIMRLVCYKGNLVVREKITLLPYMETEILGYAFLSKI